MISTSTANTDTDSCRPLVHLHQTFHPRSNMDASENVQRQHRASCSPNLEGSHLSVACLVADSTHFVALEKVSLLSGVCSYRVVVAHPAHSTHMTIQRGVPLAGVMRKCPFQWQTCEHPVCWFFTRYKGMPSLTLSSTLYGSSSHQSFTFLLPL